MLLFTRLLFHCLYASATLAHLPDRTLQKRASCTPTSAASSSIDDVPAIQAAVAQCGNGGTIVLPAGVQYTIGSPLDFKGCVNCDIQIEGTLKATNDIQYWHGKDAYVRVSGIKGGKVRSLTGTGVIDGNGQAAWDYFSTNSSLKRPGLFSVRDDSSDITVSGIHFKNPSGIFIYAGKGSTRLNFNNLYLTAVSKSGIAPKNTDGFDVWDASHVTITDTNIQNQDDCIAFKAGCNYVTVKNVKCTGSHGLSVGSLGKEVGSYHVVQNVFVDGAQMINSTKAVGIKIYPGGPNHGSSLVSNVTWKGINVQNCEYAAQIGGCYNESEEYCDTYPAASEFRDIKLYDFTGTTATKRKEDIAEVFCPHGGCKVEFQNFKVKAASGDGKVYCTGPEGAITGVTCNTPK